MNSNPMVPKPAADPADQDGADRAIEPGTVLAALALGLRLVSLAPVEPYTAETKTCLSGTVRTVGASLHFHEVGHVRRLAEILGVQAAEVSGFDVDGTYADVIVEGDDAGTHWWAWARGRGVTVPPPPPVLPRRPPAAETLTQAALLGKTLTESQPDVVSAEPVGEMTLNVVVQLRSTDDWAWWLARFTATPGPEDQGDDVTATGSYAGVTVHLLARGLGALASAVAAEAGGE